MYACTYEMTRSCDLFHTQLINHKSFSRFVSITHFHLLKSSKWLTHANSHVHQNHRRIWFLLQWCKKWKIFILFVNILFKSDTLIQFHVATTTGTQANMFYSMQKKETRLDSLYYWTCTARSGGKEMHTYQGWQQHTWEVE